MTEPLTFGSLFAGIGGLDLGLERAGMVPKWQVEIDPFCLRVLAKHWPNVGRHDDVKTFPANFIGESHVDVICGGFPCQDISCSGNGAGIHGERSGLWFEYLRIVRELRPRYIIVENVAALLYRGVDEVLGSLAEIGYDAEWSMFSSQRFGAPHRRERLFFLAYGASVDVKPKVFHRLSGEGVPQEEKNIGSEGYTRRSTCGRIRLFPPPSVCGMDDGLPSGLDFDRLRGLGNAVDPRVAEFVGRRIVAISRSR